MSDRNPSSSLMDSSIRIVAEALHTHFLEQAQGGGLEFSVTSPGFFRGSPCVVTASQSEMTTQLEDLSISSKECAIHMQRDIITGLVSNISVILPPPNNSFPITTALSQLEDDLSRARLFANLGNSVVLPDNIGRPLVGEIFAAVDKYRESKGDGGAFARLSAPLVR